MVVFASNVLYYRRNGLWHPLIKLLVGLELVEIL